MAPAAGGAQRGEWAFGEGGGVQIYNRATNTCLGEGAAVGDDQAHWWGCDGNADKSWRFEKNGDDFRVVNVKYRHCLGKGADGKAYAWDCNNEDNKFWRKNGNSLRSKQGDCLAVGDDGNAYVWGCSDSAKMRLENIGGASSAVELVRTGGDGSDTEVVDKTVGVVSTGVNIGKGVKCLFGRC